MNLLERFIKFHPMDQLGWIQWIACPVAYRTYLVPFVELEKTTAKIN